MLESPQVKEVKLHQFATRKEIEESVRKMYRKPSAVTVALLRTCQLHTMISKQVFNLRTYNNVSLFKARFGFC